MNPSPLGLTAETIEERFDEMLDAVLSSRRSAVEPARALARRSRAEQDFTLHWLAVITRTNSEMGFQFVSHAPQAFELMGFDGVEAWIIGAMDVYDRLGLYPGSEAFGNVEDFAADHALTSQRVELGDVKAVLDRYLRGLSGRYLRLHADDLTFTDTESLFLPPRCAQYNNPKENFLLYKATATHLWAQTRYGTFRRGNPEDELLSVRLDRLPNPKQARTLFARLEAHRIDACIRRDLPGLARDLQSLKTFETHAVHSPELQPIFDVLETKQASVEDTLVFVEQLIDQNIVLPPPLPWQGVLKLEQAEAMLIARVSRERDQLQAQLSQLLEQLADETGLEDAKRFELHDDEEDDNEGMVMLNLDGETIKPTAEIEQLLTSILQDFQNIPAEYLATAGSTRDDASPYVNEPGAGSVAGSDRYPDSDEGALYYPEWDFRRRHYRKNWCTLREIDMQPAPEPFVEETLAQYQGLVTELRRTFEALRDSNQRLHRQSYGEDLDLDAIIGSLADAVAGHEMSDRLFTRQRRFERDIAVVFMVDVSGSTKGWINQAERESLVLLCEALEILGDRYAVYGFSGMTRKRCELYRIKRFNDVYDDAVRARIAGIKPQDYTRMGVTIRHLTALLNNIEARTRILITLSDGKPDDYDGYRGEYGIEDTRQALLEAKHAGVHPFCITIDHTGHDYLPHMYGAVNYTVIEDVRRLPFRVSAIYRQLTT